MNLEVHSQAPAGWQRWAIEPLREPSIHQSGKMLNPPERTLPLLPHLQPFITTSIPSVSPVSVFSFPPPPQTLKPASKAQAKYFATCLVCCWCWWLRRRNDAIPASRSLSLLFLSLFQAYFILYSHLFFCESPAAFVWGQKSSPYSFTDSMGGGLNV